MGEVFAVGICGAGSGESILLSLAVIQGMWRKDVYILKYNRIIFR